MFGHLSSSLKTGAHSATNLKTKVIAFTTLSILIIGLVIALLSPATTTTSVTHADASCSPNGVTLSGSSWLNGTGVNICNNGSSYYDDYGKSCVALSGGPGGSGCPKGYVYAGEEWQCVELVNRLYLIKGWTDATWWGNGNTLVNDVPSGLTKQNNGSVSYVNPGDVITLGDNTTGTSNDDGGHAAIINTIDSNGTIHIKNQNAPLDSSAYIDSGSLSTGNAHYHMYGWGKYWVQAIIHHPNSQLTTSRPASISFEGDLNVFKIGGDGNVYQDYWDGTKWNGFSSIAGSTATNNLAVIVNGLALNIFQRNANGQVYTEYNSGNGWSGWASLGDHQMVGSPKVIMYGSSQMDVFALDTNKVPYVDKWTPGGWSGWISMGNYMASGASPGAIMYGSSEMDLFYRGGDNNIYQNKTFDGSSWSGFFSLGAPSGTTIVGDPSVLSYPPEGEFDIFVNTTSGHIYKRMFNGSWTGWADMGGGFVGNPYAMQYGSDMSLFARGTNNQIYHRYWSYSGQFWSGWGSLGGNLASDPFALQYGSSELDVFATGTDGKTYKDTFNPTNGWGGFSVLN